MRIDTEREVTQNLRSQTVAQAHILESDHPPLSPKYLIRPPRSEPGRGPRRVQKPSPAAHSSRTVLFFTGLWRPTGRKLAIPPMFPGVAMVSDPLTDGWYLCTRKLVGPMHIVCPNCSTSSAIEEASLGAGGRTVRCARCKTTWFASAHQPVPEMATAEDADAFTGVIRPDQTNASNEAPDLPPEASEPRQQPYRTTQRLQPPDSGHLYPPSPVPSIESPAHPDAAANPDEIENFAARHKRLQARRRQARAAQQCGRFNGTFRQRPGRNTRGEVRPAPVHMRPALSDLGSEILQQPLDVIELKLRPEAFAEPLAQLLGIRRAL